jgi:hypothetical protein
MGYSPKIGDDEERSFCPPVVLAPGEECVLLRKKLDCPLAGTFYVAAIKTEAALPCAWFDN